MVAVEKKAVPELRFPEFDGDWVESRLSERKAIYTRILGELKKIIQRFDEGTGSIEVNEDEVFYHVESAAGFIHCVGDKELFFTDQVKLCRSVAELARFKLVLPVSYAEGLASLVVYPVAGELFGRGIINETILTQYLNLTAEFEAVLEKSGFSFAKASEFKDGSLFWSFSEAREGSTVLEFSLNVWGYAVAIGGPVLTFLALYDSASSGFEKLQQHIRDRFKPAQAESEPAMIISKDLETEFVKIKAEREKRDLHH